MIYLIPWGERTYGRVIWEGTFADVPVTSFLVYEHSGQIFSFVQISRGVDSHALVRSQFLLILTNQVPSLCLLPRLAAKLRPFLTVLTTIPKKNIARSAMSIFIKISTGEDSPYLGP